MILVYFTWAFLLCSPAMSKLFISLCWAFWLETPR